MMAMNEVSQVETINRCPRCSSPYYVLKSVEQLSDSVNEFGRRELKFLADGIQIVQWDPGKKLYHCENCGLDFSFKDHVLERDPSANRNE